MSPVAVELIQDLPTTSHQQKQPVVSASGPTLVIGSPLTAQDGTYPSLISELERDFADTSEVERQMLDRILDGGKFFVPSSFHTKERTPTHIYSYFRDQGQVFFRPRRSLRVRI